MATKKETQDNKAEVALAGSTKAKPKTIKKEAKPKQHPSLKAIANAAAKVLGKDAVHRGSNTDYGEPKQFIDSGLEELNAVLDRDSRGWPCGRIIEIYGATATAKSGVAYDLIARAQALGGIGVLFPTEGEYSEWLAGQYGVDLDKLIIAGTNVVEDVFAAINQMMESIGKDDVLVIVIDSLAGLCTKEEFDAGSFNQDRQAQMRAQLLSKALRILGAKIPQTKTILFLVNQVRESDSTWGKPKPPGGLSPAFYSSIRLRLESQGKYKRTKDKREYVAGFNVQITAEKSRLASPFQTAQIQIDFEHGLRIKPIKKKKEQEDDGEE